MAAFVVIMARVALRCNCPGANTTEEFGLADRTLDGLWKSARFAERDSVVSLLEDSQEWGILY